MAIQNGEFIDAPELIEMSGRLSSQNTNRILKSDTSVFVNEQYSGADDFNGIAAGVKGTINTVDSTGVFPFTSKRNYSGGYTTVNDGTFYSLDLDGITVSGTTSDPDSFTDEDNAFDGDLSTYAIKSYISSNISRTASLGKTFGATSINKVRIKAFLSVEPGDATGSNTQTIYLETYNGSTWDIIETYDNSGSVPAQVQEDIIIDQIVDISDTVEGIRARFVGTGPGSDVDIHFRLYYLAEGDYNTADTVETDSIISDIVPKSIVVYADKTFPANTSITVDVSDDGGSTFPLTGNSLDSYIDTTSFSTGNLALKFNLATSDTNVTPKLFGYGLAITDA